jgi:hypothetical protein
MTARTGFAMTKPATFASSEMSWGTPGCGAGNGRRHCSGPQLVDERPLDSRLVRDVALPVHETGGH